MSILSQLNTRPSSANLKKLLISGLILFFIVYPLMSYFSFLSKCPTGIVQSELSFSGPAMKSDYLYMQFFGDINAYLIFEILDYGFMVAYGLILFSILLRNSRQFAPNSVMRKGGQIFALCAIIAPLCDVVENGFILASLQNPLYFPDWWTVIHSAFSLVKWILLSLIVIWLIFAFVLEIKQKKTIKSLN